MATKSHLFLCHSSKDKKFVRKLAADLENNHIKVWLDEWEIKIGDSLINKIQHGIAESSWLGVVLSINSVESSWVNLELNSAKTIELEKKQVFILPIVIDNCQIPLFLREKLFADFRRRYKLGLNALLSRFDDDDRTTILDKVKEEKLLAHLINNIYSIRGIYDFFHLENDLPKLFKNVRNRNLLRNKIDEILQKEINDEDWYLNSYAIINDLKKMNEELKLGYGRMIEYLLKGEQSFDDYMFDGE